MKQEKLISNTYSDQDDTDYIYEQCFMCQEELTEINKIFLTVDDNDLYSDDRYICESCAKEHGFKVVPCADLD